MLARAGARAYLEGLGRGFPAARASLVIPMRSGRAARSSRDFPPELDSPAMRGASPSAIPPASSFPLFHFVSGARVPGEEVRRAVLVSFDGARRPPLAQLLEDPSKCARGRLPADRGAGALAAAPSRRLPPYRRHTSRPSRAPFPRHELVSNWMLDPSEPSGEHLRSTRRFGRRRLGRRRHAARRVMRHPAGTEDPERSAMWPYLAADAGLAPAQLLHSESSAWKPPGAGRGSSPSAPTEVAFSDTPTPFDSSRWIDRRRPLTTMGYGSIRRPAKLRKSGPGTGLASR